MTISSGRFDPDTNSQFIRGAIAMNHDAVVEIIATLGFRESLTMILSSAECAPHRVAIVAAIEAYQYRRLAAA